MKIDLFFGGTADDPASVINMLHVGYGVIFVSGYNRLTDGGASRAYYFDDDTQAKTHMIIGAMALIAKGWLVA